MSYLILSAFRGVVIDKVALTHCWVLLL